MQVATVRTYGIFDDIHIIAVPEGILCSSAHTDVGLDSNEYQPLDAGFTQDQIQICGEKCAVAPLEDSVFI